MVEDVALRATVSAPSHSCQEEIVGMLEQLVNPPPTAMSPSLCNLFHPVEDIWTLGIFRSENEQLIGHELIKALRKLKLSKIPLSPSSLHESPSKNEANVVHLKGNHSSYRQRKVNTNLENQALKWYKIC
jgi:hypothetical protein